MAALACGAPRALGRPGLPLGPGSIRPLGPLSPLGPFSRAFAPQGAADACGHPPGVRRSQGAGPPRPAPRAGLNPSLGSFESFGSL